MLYNTKLHYIKINYVILNYVILGYLISNYKFHYIIYITVMEHTLASLLREREAVESRILRCQQLM